MATTTTEIRRFLSANRDEIEASIRRVTPPEMADVLGLVDGKWIELVAGPESTLDSAEAELRADYRRLLEAETEYADKKDYGRAKWASSRANTIKSEDIISFLSRKAVIPKYGFPVDVVSLDTPDQKVELERDLSLAVAEYAPGAQVVAAKKVWTSSGLKRVPEKEWDVRNYWRCEEHHRFETWETAGEPEHAEHCCEKATAGKYIVPQFGFVTRMDEKEGKTPTGRPRRMYSTRPFFLGFNRTPEEAVAMPAGNPLLRLTKACPGTMGVVCEGYRGRGFYICRNCGAGFAKPAEKRHEKPWGGECSGKLKEKFALGHEFVTDVVQIEFVFASSAVGDRLGFAHSLAYALLGGAAEVLEIPSNDLGATVGKMDDGLMPPIVLYDNVPGGAGLVARLEGEEIFLQCLEEACKRVSGRCGCAENASCYGCLRSYRNQFLHARLQRGPVKAFLEEIRGKWR